MGMPPAPKRPSGQRQTGPALEAMNTFLRWLIPAVEKFPKSQKFLLGDRLQATALDVLEHLIEATYCRDRRTPLKAANLGIEKLRHLIRLAHDLHHLDPRRYEYAAREIDGVGRLIGGKGRRGSRAESANTPGIGDRALCRLTERGGEWTGRVIKKLDKRDDLPVIGLFTATGHAEYSALSLGVVEIEKGNREGHPRNLRRDVPARPASGPVRPMDRSVGGVGGGGRQ
ncbi:MAG: diversity-generating retroelement protein Avd [Pseudomonadota bacterium]